MLKPIYKICTKGLFCYGAHHFKVQNSILQLSRAYLIFISSEPARTEVKFKKKKSVIRPNTF